MTEGPLEIERKYRLAHPPSPDDLSVRGARSFRLEQVYLAEPPPGRRIRRIEAPDGAVSHRLTTKRHLRDLVREEVEIEIDAAEYQRLVAEADPGRHPIRKTRHVVAHGAQQLEIDVFEEPAGLVLVEVELASETESVELPEWLGKARDVSTDPRYANANLALRAAIVPRYSVGPAPPAEPGIIPAMTDRGLPIVDGAPACPFVAFDDDRDGRSQAPDHRHRCFAEARPAPRALAHQEAYCLSSAFPVCPTFQDWARREAAATRSAAGEAPASPAPESAPPQSPPMASREVDAYDHAAETDASMPPRRNPPRDWAAPPPWSGQDVAGEPEPERAGPAGGAAAGSAAAGSAATGSAAAGLAGSAAYRLAGPDPDEPQPARPVDAPGADAYGRYDAAAGRSRAGGSVDDAPDRGDELADPYGAEVGAGAYGSYEPRGAGRASGPASSGSGSRPSTSQARPSPGGYEPEDPSEIFGPAWEHPRRYEAYPTLRTRVGLPAFGGVPRLGLAALAVVVAALALFFVGPMLLGIGSNDGVGGGPTVVPSADASLTPAPTIPPEPTPQTYVVVKGDTLSKIAKRFGVTVEEIQAANPQIKNINKIAIGDQIIIPVPQPSGVPDASEEVTSVP